MPEVTSFLEVDEGDAIVVVVGGRRYVLGDIERVYCTHPNYIVWADRDFKVWFEIDHSAVTLSDAFHAFWVRCQDLLCRSRHNFGEQRSWMYLGMLAAAISNALEEQFTHAAESLDSAERYLSDTNQRASKGRYIFGVLAAVVVALVAAWGLKTFPFGGPSVLAPLVITALIGGAIGGFLSALSGEIRDVRFDPDATAREGYLNGSLRVLYGVFGAFVVVVAVKSGVISSSLITPENEPLALLCIAFGGGFTERQAANIVKRFADAKDDD